MAHAVMDGGARQVQLQQAARHTAVQRLGVAQVDLTRVVDRDAGVHITHTGVLLLHAEGGYTDTGR